jgi:hypothetical protein
MLENKKNLIIYLTLLISCSVFLPYISKAQVKRSISGVVVAQENDKPIQGVNIILQNKGISSITNSDGKFVILLPNNPSESDSLTFSCIGYASKKVNVIQAFLMPNLNIKLNTFITDLKEVVIKTLSLRQLLDSLLQHNKSLFISPITLKGYYREFVYTNNKCTEFSDALGEYFYDQESSPNGILIINASRCLKAPVTEKQDRHNYEVDAESTINPNLFLKYTMLSGLITKYFPDKLLSNYDYKIKKVDDDNFSDIQIDIYPKKSGIFKWELSTTKDFTLKSYHFEIPDSCVKKIQERNLLGLHTKLQKFTIDVQYSNTAIKIYPNFYSISLVNMLWGHLLGVSINNELIEKKSEFVTTDIDETRDINFFNKKNVYKKGNLCGNGVAISDTLLRKYTIIIPSKKESIDINGFK